MPNSGACNHSRYLLVDGTYHVNFTHEAWCNYTGPTKPPLTNLTTMVPWVVNVPPQMVEDKNYQHNRQGEPQERVTTMLCERSFTLLYWDSATASASLVVRPFKDFTSNLAPSYSALPDTDNAQYGSKISGYLCEG